MHNDLNLSTITLARGGLWRVSAGRGQQVLCLDGTLWLTQEGDPRDVVLEAGEQALIERDGLSVVSALSDSRFVLLHDAASLGPLLHARQAQAALAAH